MAVPTRGAALLSAAVMALLACSGDSDDGDRTTSSASQDEGTTTTGAPDLRYVALGDSWPEGAHCGGCQPFPELHSEAVAEATGHTIDFKNLAGDAQPYFGDLSGGTASLLEALRADEDFRAEVASADVIVIATGANDGEPLLAQVRDGTCGGGDNFDCVRELGQMWRSEFDAILDEVQSLRAGEPTAIRVVNAANAFIGAPLPGLDEATNAAYSSLFFEELTRAVCDSAAAHQAVCLDVRPILNGPDLGQAVDDSSPESMRAVADALTEIGVQELN